MMCVLLSAVLEPYVNQKLCVKFEASER